MLVSDLNKPSQLMATLANQLNTFRNAMEGGLQFKLFVLKKRPKENVMLYEDRLQNVSVLPICKSMINEIIDIVFDEEPVRTNAFLNLNGSPIDTPTWFDNFLEDSDLQSTTFTTFMESVASASSVEGWCWIFVDLPETPNTHNRPYLTLIPAQHVIDWHFENEDGINTLTYLKVIEYQDDKIRKIKYGREVMLEVKTTKVMLLVNHLQQQLVMKYQ